MNKSLLKKYENTIKDDYNKILNNENYKDIILEEFKGDKELTKYFTKYMSEEEGLDKDWATVMYLFVKASKDKNVTLTEEYYKGLKSYKSNYYVEFVLGDINLMYYGNLFEAKERFAKAIALKEDDAAAHYNLGFIYNLLGIFSKSLEHYNKAIYFNENSVNPSNIKLNALYNVGIHYATVEKENEKAEEIFESILKEDPDNKNALLALKKLKGEM